MSSQKGNVSRSRGQKHQNTTAFKNDKHGATVQLKVCIFFLLVIIHAAAKVNFPLFILVIVHLRKICSFSCFDL